MAIAVYETTELQFDREQWGSRVMPVNPETVAPETELWPVPARPSGSPYSALATAYRAMPVRPDRSREPRVELEPSS